MRFRAVDGPSASEKDEEEPDEEEGSVGDGQGEEGHHVV